MLARNIDSGADHLSLPTVYSKEAVVKRGSIVGVRARRSYRYALCGLVWRVVRNV